MRDIIANMDRPNKQHSNTQYNNHYELPDIDTIKLATYDNDQESISSQDSRTSSNTGGKSDIPTYRSYQKYLDGYSSLKFKSVKPNLVLEAVEHNSELEHTAVDGIAFKEDEKARVASTHSESNVNNNDAYKAEFMIQIKPPRPAMANMCKRVPQHRSQHDQPRETKIADKQTSVGNVITPVGLEVAPPLPPPPPPAMPDLSAGMINSQTMNKLLIENNVRFVGSMPRGANASHVQHASDLRTCLLSELKAKHPPKEYHQCHGRNDNKEVKHHDFLRRTSEPLNQTNRMNFPSGPPAPSLSQLNKPQVPKKLATEFVLKLPQNTRKQVTSLPRRNSEQDKLHMLSKVEAELGTRVPPSRDDPNVKKLVYATLRNYVGGYNNRANLLVAKHGNVVQDKGVSEQIKSITACGNMAHLNGRINPNEADYRVRPRFRRTPKKACGPDWNLREKHNKRAQGPPPPPILSGNLPATRLKSEIGERRHEPPVCVQNAMMTKDKKPFTYTPGGIDLSEIKSPRMARRIERNAAAPGVGELPQQPPNHSQVNRHLPPSALAAMQPQLPIQVFPSGAPPPPPPPSANILPPPPPMQAFLTKPVANNNDGVYERPDMTRIIPENPMAILRKTPKVERKTFLDELSDMERKNKQVPQGPPPVNNGCMPRSPQSPHIQQSQYSPQPQQQQQSPQYNRQPSYTTQPQPYSPQHGYPPANSHSIPQMVQQQSVESNGPPSPPTKTSSASIGTLYIAPINQQQQMQHQISLQQIPSSPHPPQRQHSLSQSPQTPQSPIPKLNAAPKPWQNQQRKEPELPEWAQRHQQSPPKEETVQPVRIAVQPPRITPLQMPPPPSRPGVEVVYVTQPEVYQHLGPIDRQKWAPSNVQPQKNFQKQQEQQQQYMRQEMKGTRIIPIQIEGANSGPNTPTGYDRQQSWVPTQSNSFKVIQKMTENDDVDQEQVEYGPRSAQQFPADQMRKMNLNDGNRDKMNRIKQDFINKSDEENPRYCGGCIPSRIFRIIDQSGVDEEMHLHNESDPRYRSAAIPSKAFRMLQHLINTPDHPAHASTVPKSSIQTGPTNVVHTIPIKIEGETTQPYLHPSQQTVEEPRKYMGSAIPSKAFQMLQAMTNSPAASNIDLQYSEISDQIDAETNDSRSPTRTTLPTSHSCYITYSTPGSSPMYALPYFDPYMYDYYMNYY